ncbi:hypothetical protein [Pseudonocardia lacus]|uniref:hypothetical protein n=1 Tax=Pseudonocardia lacus TaxID=2835865 RepID=UPI001BDBCAA4|nr:hypothetical protein [Pseudonocardia lacus]
MPAPNPKVLRDAAATLRTLATAVRGALDEYRTERSKLVWTGPGRQHLEAYHQPSLDWLQRILDRLRRAISALERAEADLVRRIGELRTDEERVRAELPRYFERLHYDPAQVADYLRGLPPPEDPRWADFARTIVGHSATGRR